MANAVGLNYSKLFNTTETINSKRTQFTNKNVTADTNVNAQYNGNYAVELSDKGLNSLAQTQKNTVDNSDTKNFIADETKLSSKAQSFLDKLRDKYDDYDFIIADNVDDPQSLTAQSKKGYSVILSSDEIEKMADDEEFANKIMSNVDKAVGVIDGLFDESLDKGVQFASISASIDSEGNTKLFASLEKMSEDQQERFEKLKEKLAEQKDDKTNEKTEITDETKSESESEPEPITILAKTANVEADSAEDLLKKISEIDWQNINEEEFIF